MKFQVMRDLADDGYSAETLIALFCDGDTGGECAELARQAAGEALRSNAEDRRAIFFGLERGKPTVPMFASEDGQVVSTTFPLRIESGHVFRADRNDGEGQYGYHTTARVVDYPTQVLRAPYMTTFGDEWQVVVRITESGPEIVSGQKDPDLCETALSMARQALDVLVKLI